MVVKWKTAVIELDDYYLVPTVSVRFRERWANFGAVTLG